MFVFKSSSSPFCCMKRQVMGWMVWKIFLFLILFANYMCHAEFTQGSLLTIKPVSCSVVKNNKTLEGTCMFVWDCIRKKGKHLSTCRYKFLFGSCCSVPTSNDIIPPQDEKKVEFYHNKPTAKPFLNFLPFDLGSKTITTKRPTFTTNVTTKLPTVLTRPQAPVTQLSVTLSVLNNKENNNLVLENDEYSPNKQFVLQQTSSYNFYSAQTGSNLFDIRTKLPHVPTKPTKTRTTSITATPSTTTSTTSTTLTPSTATTKRTTIVPTQKTTVSKSQYTFKTPYKIKTTQSPFFVTKKSNIYLKPSVYTKRITITTSATTSTPPNRDIKWDYYKGCGIPPLFKNGRPGHTRIVGGKNTLFGQFPWQVSVRRTSFFGFSSTHRCGGALIDAQWVATAGHCVDDLMKSQIRVRIGEYDFARVTEAFQHEELGILAKIVHPKYNFFTYENDLALIKLEKKLDLRPNVWPICLPPNDHNLIGQEATVTGWGRLSDSGILPSILQEVQVPILSNEKCKNMFLKRNKHEYIPGIFVCAGYDQGGRDSCQGDSGGPLQVKKHGRWFLAGIVSWGIGCAEPNLPGVSTRISKFKSWILTQLRNNQ